MRAVRKIKHAWSRIFKRYRSDGQFLKAKLRKNATVEIEPSMSDRGGSWHCHWQCVRGTTCLPSRIMAPDLKLEKVWRGREPANLHDNAVSQDCNLLTLRSQQFVSSIRHYFSTSDAF